MSLRLAIILLLYCTNAAADSRMQSTVKAFVAAFNHRDVQAMLALTTDDIRWMFVADAELTVQTQGKAALRDAMTQYFQGQTDTQSTIMQLSADGPFVYAVEQARWTGADGESQTQCSNAVYEFEEKAIKNVWYFASYAC